MTYKRIRDGSPLSIAYDMAMMRRECPCDDFVPICLEYIDPSATERSKNTYDYPWLLRYYCVGCRMSGMMELDGSCIHKLFAGIDRAKLAEFTGYSERNFGKTQISDLVETGDGMDPFRLIRNYDRHERRVIKWYPDGRSA